MRDFVIEEIKRQCGRVRVLDNGWCYFIYQYLDYIYIPGLDNDMIRIALPHIEQSASYNKETIDRAVNETNREVKFVKLVVLNNGSVSINYDHKLIQGENVKDVIPHIIETLYSASQYFKLKIQEL